MKEVRLGLIGFGNVGQGLTQILRDYGKEYSARYGVRFIISAISDPVKGNLAYQNGFDSEQLLDVVQKEGNLKDLAEKYPGWDALDMITNSNTDAIIELSYTDLKTGEPATTYVKTALQNHKDVVTTNKGPVALHYNELVVLAKENGVQIGVEGTVMSGTPVLRVGRELLSAAGINCVQGILNGTTNYILTRMERGVTYVEALIEAQKAGYAEADPTGDVEGYDTAGKVVILANLLFNTPMTMQQVDRHGITNLAKEDIETARVDGMCWKLIGTIEYQNGDWNAVVRPTCLPLAHPLARVSGATNAITFTTTLLGDVTIVGPGAGRLQTGYAVIEDLLAIYRQ